MSLLLSALGRYRRFGEIWCFGVGTYAHPHTDGLIQLDADSPAAFYLDGEILFRSRLSQDMFRGRAPWMARLPGGLAHTNIVGCAIFPAVSGSSVATLTTVRKMSIPELRKRGYPDYTSHSGRDRSMYAGCATATEAAAIGGI